MKNPRSYRADASYEWKAVTLLALGFGLVSIDRFMIMPLFPVMMKDLNLNYQDLGLITGILAVTWGISSLFMGKLSDRFGHRAGGSAQDPHPSGNVHPLPALLRR